MAQKRTTPSISFKIFAVAMVIFFGLGSILVVGVSIFGGGDESPHSGSTGATIDPGDEQIEILGTSVATNPDDYESAALLANILANSGQSGESLDYFEIAVAGDSDDGGLRLSYGIALFRTGNLFDSEVQLLKAYDLDVDRAGPAYYLGQLYENQENADVDAAITWYERAIEIGPDDSIVAGQARERLEVIAALPTPTAE